MKLISYAGHALRTVTGFYQNEYNEQWDKKLNDILDNGVIVGDINPSQFYTLDIMYREKLYAIWVGNKYYSYGNACSVCDKHTKDHEKVRPRFKTMLKLNCIATKALKEKTKSDIDKLIKG